jgi:hypothetical protein
MAEICKNCDHHLDDHYKYECNGESGCFCSNSDYVRKPDYEELEAQNNKLVEALEKSKAFAESISINSMGLIKVKADELAREIETVLAE